MTAALNTPEPSRPDAFLGQVFRRASPILTWRPALEARAERERVARVNVEELSGASLIEDRESIRISRAPTRKMVAWPIMPRLRREKPEGEARRQLVRTVGAGVVGALLLALAVVALGAAGAWAFHGAARPEAPVARVVASHVLDERVDTLAPPPPVVAAVAPAPPPVVAPQPAMQAAKAAPHANSRGRAHLGRHPTASKKHGSTPSAA